MYCRAAVLAACFAAVSCSRQTPAKTPVRIAVLRFENLSTDSSLDWMGRAFSEVVSRELAGDPGSYAIPPSRLHNLDSGWGRRAPGTPGVSAERALALVSGANQLGFGEYWLENGRLQARLTLEEAPSQKNTTVVSASAAAGDVLGAAGRLARQISRRASAYATSNAAALRAYVQGLESADPALASQDFEAAIAADPDFGEPYDLLAQFRLQQRDRAGAMALLAQALQRRERMPELEGAQIAFNAATLRGDAAASQQALAIWSRAVPRDPAAWRAVAESATSRHDYGQAVQAYQRALEAQPDDTFLLNSLGYAAAYNGDLAAGVRALQRYQVLRPGEANPLDSLGDVNLLFGRLREAEDFYLQAARKDPNFEGGADFRKAAVARLMGGDVEGAAKLDQQFVDRRRAGRDPLVEYRQAEWSWMAGRRREAYSRLSAFAKSAEGGALREAASEAYSELAMWSLALGDHGAAPGLAEKAQALAGPVSAPTAAVARFVAQPPAAADEWANRAERAFPGEQKPVRDLAQAYALLAASHFREAAAVLQRIYDSGVAAPAENVPLLLAWADLETGKPKEAASLLRFNPLPAGNGVRPFLVFYFPRLFYLRGRIAMLAGSSDRARAQDRLFLQLSGETPLVWGEEEKARSFATGSR